MPKLSRSVLLAAWSILILSSLHIVFWAFLAFAVFTTGLNEGQFTALFILLCLISAGGMAGVGIAAGILKARRWARIGALVLGALTALICVFAIVILAALLLLDSQQFGFAANLVEENRPNFVKAALGYLFVLLLALWWIWLFSRNSVVAEFTANLEPDTSVRLRRQGCPPPIALLAWLMILSSGLTAVSWPLILGKIPAMLFTHIFSLSASKWIWIANIALFLACGAGLLKLRRWAYHGAILLHVFWMLSAFVSQLSTDYEAYIRQCIETLGLGEAYPVLNRIHCSPWISAITTAIPTALLIACLFYYRGAFLRAVDDSRHLSS